LGADALYPAFARRGLAYGPAFRGITALYQGEQQLLVELTLPKEAQLRGGDYLMHPSLMDSALQGSITLIDDLMSLSGKPSLPFALESLQVLAPCTGEMVAWVRSGTGNLRKVDIDLCDQDGKVCVQMRGFSSRPMESAGGFDEAHYRSILAGVLGNRISAEQAAELS
jgi:polyketide synthase PksL